MTVWWGFDLAIHVHTHTHTLEVAYTKDSHKPLTPEQLVLMYLLQGSHLPTSDSVSEARVQHKDSIPLARVFIDVCETDREAYWLFARFSKMVDRIDKDMLVRTTRNVRSLCTDILMFLSIFRKAVVFIMLRKRTLVCVPTSGV